MEYITFKMFLGPRKGDHINIEPIHDDDEQNNIVGYLSFLG